MEIFYQTRSNVYPYHRRMGQQKTSVEHLQPFSSKQMANQIKQFSKIYKTIQCPFLIPLFRVLKGDQHIHMIYQYHDKSLSDYLPKHTHSQIKRIEQSITCALKSLEKAKLRVDIRIDNVVVTDQGNIKLFVVPDAEDPLNATDLQQFYATQKTRIHFELQQLWQQIRGNDLDETQKEQNSPGFIISKNKLVFIKNSDDKETSSKDSPMGNQSPIQINSHPDSCKNIRVVIQKQKQIAEKYKHKKSLPNNKKVQTQENHSSEDKNKQVGLSKAISSNQDLNLKKKIPQVNSGSNMNNFKPKEKMSNSTNYRVECQQQNSEQRPVSSYHPYKKNQDYSEGSSTQNRDSNKPSPKKQEEKQKRRHSQQQKVQIMTQMISKYKMKIVTCQQIEFEGMDGEDFEKLAQQKLVEYRNQHGYQNAIENQSTQETKQTVHVEEKHEVPQQNKRHTEQFLNRILKTKQKACTALKQYTKNRKK